jgi:hypothetical protein
MQQRLRTGGHNDVIVVRARAEHRQSNLATSVRVVNRFHHLLAVYERSQTRADGFDPEAVHAAEHQRQRRRRDRLEHAVHDLANLH